MRSPHVFNHTAEEDDQAHIHGTRLFWVTRSGRLVQRSWNELTKTERERQRQAETRAYYVLLFHIYA